VAGVLAVSLTLALALGAPVVARLAGARAGRTLSLLPLGLFVYFASLAPRIRDGDNIAWSREWVASLGVDLSFYIDGLALLFALLICGMGALVLIYSDGYMAGRHQVDRFYAFLLLFMASMLGLVLAGNLLTLFVFWELTSFSSYFLIGIENDREPARRAALQALLVTGGGGLAVLAGFVLLGQAAGTYEVTDLLQNPGSLQEHTHYHAILALVTLGAFTKSAQFPFHFWLPNAMEAPTPVSAYLHSATMVKAGVYLLARLSPVLGGTDAWLYTLAGAGGATMLLGAHLSLLQTDLKRTLAYSTVSALGMLTMLVGLGSPLAIKAAVVLLLAHGLYKGALFLVAGSVDHETGDRDFARLGGLRRAMPLTAAAGALAGLSMAGVAPLLGFMSKEALYEAATEAEAWAVIVPVAASILLVAAAANVGLRPFWGTPPLRQQAVHEAGTTIWAPALLLASAGLVLGLAPGLVDGSLLSPAASAVIGEETSVQLTLWHGITTVLGLSVATLAAGGILFVRRLAYARLMTGPVGLRRVAADRAYDALIAGLNWLALSQTRLLQSGYLRVYLLVVVGVTVAGAASILALRGDPGTVVVSSDIRFYEAIVAGAIVLGSLAAMLMDSRFAAVAALGVVGYSTGLVYLFFGAPDLAMTQVLVDTLVVILFAFVFYHLPRFSLLSRPVGRLRDAVFCGAAGLLMTGLVLLATNATPQKPASQFYIEASRPQANGDNVVNVILVDFRALDTLGEITVLATAGIGVLALLRLRPGSQRERP
jgi:multicomponent Na+:H+ antiporter subunit A